MADTAVQIEVDGAPEDGSVVLILTNGSAEPVALAPAPVVGIRVRALSGGWRAACRLDPRPAPFEPLAPGEARRIAVRWVDALRAEEPPPAGRYLVRLAVVVEDEVRFTPAASTRFASR